MPVKKRVFGVLFLALCLVICFSLVSASFNVDNLLLKISSKVGSIVIKPIILSSDSGGQFSMEVVGVKGVTVNVASLAFGVGEGKSINVSFNSTGIEPGVYTGSIRISGSDKTYYLPIIFEVESKDVFFDANLEIPSDYSEIAPGGKVVAQIKIFDLSSGGTNDGVGTQSISLEYKISDSMGNVISSETENVAVNKETQITKTVSFPSSIKEGDYVFSVLVKYKSSLGTSSQLFRIKKAGFADISGQTNSGLFLILGAVVIFFIIMLMFFVYVIRDRDKFILELKRYNAWELKRQKEFLAAQARLVSKRRKARPEELEKEVEQKIRELKEKQVKRIKELRKLKGDGNVKEMKARLSEWKKKGYNTVGLEYKLKGLSVKEMKQLMNKWKKQYKNRRV